MRRPFHQQLLKTLGFVLWGFIALGSFINAINNALQLLTFRVAFGGTIAILVFLLASSVFLRIRGLPWLIDGSIARLRRLGVLPIGGSLGAILLLWIPSLLQPSQIPTPGRPAAGPPRPAAHTYTAAVPPATAYREFNDSQLKQLVALALERAAPGEAIAMLPHIRATGSRQEEAMRIFKFCIANDAITNANAVISYLSPSERTAAERELTIKKFQQQTEKGDVP